MSNFSFGYQPNGVVCSCGKHHGVGNIAPEERAAKLARMREKMPKIMSPYMIEYLIDFEKSHGTVKYDMVQDSVMEGHFVKASKGHPLIVPKYNYQSDKFKGSSF